MKRILPLLAISSIGFAAGSLGVGYPDGTQVTIQTASTGLNVQEIIYNDGVYRATEDGVWHRVVSDKQKKVLFAYDLEAGHGSTPGTFFLRIKPVDTAYARKLQAAPVPTVAAVREFGAVKAGQSVALDILSFPATGDRIFDVLQPSDSGASQQASGDEFEFHDFSVSLNGHPIKELAGIGMTGGGAMFYVPGRGAYFLSPEPRPGFQQTAHVEPGKLWFDLDYDHIEMTAKGRLLKKSDRAVVWVKHDPAFRSPAQRRSEKLMELDRNLAQAIVELGSLSRQYKSDHPAVKQIQTTIDSLTAQRKRLADPAADEAYMGTADNVDWLMPKKD